MKNDSMINSNQESPPVLRLKYKKGELIIKEGDYGISIYKINKGEVEIFNETIDGDVTLATLGRGDIIGEMAFLGRGYEPRAASARAVEDTEVEVWHPVTLMKEYEQMPPILKRMADQAVKRLIRMQKLLGQEGVDKPKKGERGASGRRYVRKKLDQDCVYKPVGSKLEIRLRGKIQDISIAGVGIQVKAQNAEQTPHRPGDQFYVYTILPNDKKLEFKARILSVNKGALGGLFLSMSITEMDEEAGNILGFFIKEDQEGGSTNAR
jgi:CRP-like cAMP-binding protein